MAYVTIHPIKSTLNKAIEYICDPKKTDNQKNISCHSCDFKTAEKMFEYTRNKHYSNVKILAFHVVQSFKKGEVTPEQAQAIGRKTMSRFLGGEYEYIIATHNDTECIHNHVIINSVNMINGKAFSSEHDRKSCPAWRKLQHISDEILIENGLSIIDEPEKTSISHYEWSMEKQGTSWKSQLKKIIDETIRNVDSFDEFISALRGQNITVRYEPYKTKEGMILAFKMNGQKNFIYSQKLGKYYLENKIKDRIERSVTRRNMTRTERRQERILSDNGELKKLYNVEDMDSIGLQKWAKKENRKIQMQTLIELHKKGFSSTYEFDDYRKKLQNVISENTEYYAHLKNKKTEMTELLKYIEIYRDYSEIYDYYKNVTYYPDRYFRRHEKEILLFEEAKTELEKHFEIIPNKAQYANEIESIDSKMVELRQQNRELREELRSLEKLKFNLDIIYEKEPERQAANEPTDHQTAERKKQRTEDFDIDL